MLTKADLAEPTIIEGWVRDLALTPSRRDDATNNWHVQFQTGGINAFTISCVNPKALPRAIMLVCGMVAAPENITAFATLTAAQKKVFWERLRDILKRESVEYQIDGALIDECPKTIRVTAIRFDDGLSLDSFAQSLALVCRASSDAVAHFNESLLDARPRSN
jgi:hypothetical protein